jgi:hypothetical protein
MKKILSLLLVSGLMYAADDDAGQLVFKLRCWVKGANVERNSPVVLDELDLARRESITGKTFTELRKRAFDKGVPLLVMAVLKISAESGLSIDYLDGFTLLDSITSDRLSTYQGAHNCISENVESRFKHLFMTIHAPVVVYPDVQLAKNELFLGKVDGKPFYELDSIARVYFNNNDLVEIKKILKVREWFFNQKPTIAKAKQFKFWLKRALELDDSGDNTEKCKKEIELIDEYLSSHKEK